MVSVLTSSMVDRGIDRVKSKTIKLAFVASLLSTQHKGERAQTGWLGIKIMCPYGATCLSTDCCFSELALLKSSTACWSSMDLIIISLKINLFSPSYS